MTQRSFIATTAAGRFDAPSVNARTESRRRWGLGCPSRVNSRLAASRRTTPVRRVRFRATGSRSPHACHSSTSLRVLARPTADHDKADLRVVHPNIYPNNWVLVRPTQSHGPVSTLLRPGRAGTDGDESGRRETPPTSLIMLRSLVRFQLAPLGKLMLKWTSAPLRPIPPSDRYVLLIPAMSRRSGMCATGRRIQG
jgi:hypothetical protein